MASSEATGTIGCIR